MASSLNNLALLYQSQGQYAEAESLYKRALAIREKALGPDHPDVARTLENYAALLRKAQRNTEAEEMEARAKSIRAMTPQREPLLDIEDKGDSFFDPQYKVTGKFPDGWKMRGAGRWGTQETTLSFQDPDYPNAAPKLYYRIFPEPMQLTTEQIGAWLRDGADAKVWQRVSEGLADYTNGELVERTIGDRPALTWTGSYTRDGQPWGEYLTRIYTPNGTFLFFLHAPNTDLPALIPKFERMITTTIVP